MRSIIIPLIAFIGFFAAQPATPKSNALSPDEAAEGWLLLFDGETSYGWSATPGDKTTVKDDALQLIGPSAIQTTTAHREFALQFKCRITGAQAHEAVKLLFGTTTIKMALPNDKNAPWNTAKLIVAGGNYKFTMTSGSSDFPVVAGQLSSRGASELSFVVADGVKLELRDVTLLPLNQKPLFNGKTLDGWKEFAGKKYVSKFSVNDKLELNVKNGPGDLQTDGKYGDFLLQLDCISNGKNLNSGVFFRCKPNEYQNGYECQIHNGWNASAPKDFIAEIYDPKTHQLVSKEKMKTNAIDGGTGAIYRRMVARKQVAKDFEWFTLTVVAHGNHFATWVNGIQVCDWTDNRPPNDNPRNGCRLEAGHISIQGHDPTTDLSFRNLRLAEYPTGK